MAQPDLRGKTKKDLAAIAHISGLLTPTDTSRMTKQQLLDFLMSVAEDPHEASVVSSVKEEMVIPGAKMKADQDNESVDKEVEKKSRKSRSVEVKDKDRRDDKKSKVEEAAVTDEVAQVEGDEKVKPSEPKEDKASSESSTAKKAKTSTRKTRTTKSKKTESEEEKKTSKSVRTVGKASATKPAKDADIEEEAESSSDVKTLEVSVEPVKDETSTESLENGLPQDLESDEHAEDEEKSEEKPQEIMTGVLEVMPEGYGFLRVDNYIQSSRDIYVPPQYIRRFNLRTGDLVTGPVRQQRDNDRYKALFYIREVNGETPDKMIRRPHFDRLTPIYPRQRYTLETSREELSTRIIDLICPIGKGQRGMIVSPPKAGKTIFLQKIANAITVNNPDAKLIVLLIDERPEEVTDMQRSIEGEVVYSTFDKTPENHVRITELVLERAMRLVELGKDVVILLDSITRMGRAYNLTINPTGRTLSGGLDPGALYGPKRFFGAARNIEHGGSLTIIATALIETGSRMDEVIFEEFKGTGNMEVILDRKLADKRIFPAIDITRSGTRREELLLTEKELDAVWILRKTFSQLETAAVTETMLGLLLKTRDNDQFISSINVSMTDKSLFDAMRGGMPKRDTNSTGPSSRINNP